MPSKLARLIVVLSLASLVACTTVRTVAERGSGSISAQQLGTIVGPKNTLTITRTDGSIMLMKVSAVLPDAIEGTLAGSTEVTRLPLDQVRKIERREFDGVKTTILVVVLAGALYLLIQAAGASAAASAIG